MERQIIEVNTMAKMSKKSPKVARKAAAKRVTPRPALLSGGNPHIGKADGDAPVQAYIAAMPGWKRDVGRHLDALIERTVPGVRKTVKWNSPFYGVKGGDWFLGMHCFTNYVETAFLRATLLRAVPPGALTSLGGRVVASSQISAHRQPPTRLAFHHQYAFLELGRPHRRAPAREAGPE